MRPGQSFETAEVVDNYQYRPDYPDSLINKLSELVPNHQTALDLGCGPGKIARPIAQHFDTVVAVDPSQKMLDKAQSLHTDGGNILWRCGIAEEFELEHQFDLVVAAASIHWMDHGVLFPRLQNHVSQQYAVAIVEGDTAHQPPWEDGWQVFLGKWIYELTGERYKPGSTQTSFHQRMNRHKQWLNLEGQATFDTTVTQSIGDFIRCQFSRDTFAPSKLGSRVDKYRAELNELLEQYADGDLLTFNVRSNVEWGQIA